MNTCVRVDVELEGESLAHYRVSGIPIECRLVISDRPSLHTTNIAVDKGPIKGKTPGCPIVEGCPEGEYSVLEPRMQGGRIPTGPTSGEKWVLVFTGGALHGNQPLFPPISVRWEMGGVFRRSGDFIREVRSSGPRTVVDDRGDATNPTLRSRGS